MSPLDAGADDERLRGFQRTFADNVDLPAGASVIDEPVTVVAIADVRFPEGRRASASTSLRTLGLPSRKWRQPPRLGVAA